MSVILEGLRHLLCGCHGEWVPLMALFGVSGTAVRMFRWRRGGKSE